MVPAFLLRGFWDEVERRGVSLAELEHASGVPRPRAGDCATTLPAAEMHRLFEVAQAITGDEFLGLTAGRAIGAAGFHFVGHLVLASGTLSQALDTVARVQPQLRKRSPSLQALPDGKLRMGLRLDADPLRPGARIEAELTAVLMHDVVLLFFADGAHERPALELPFPAPVDTRVYRRMFPGGVRFGGDGIYVSFPRSALALRRNGTDSGLLEQLLELALDQYRAMSLDDSWTQRVQGALRAQPAPRLTEAGALAGQLGVSTRGLARRLAREGTTLSGLLELELYARACLLLRRPGANASRVAQALGYAELSSFFRAFRRWSGGLTPNEYRRGHDQEAGVHRVR